MSERPHTTHLRLDIHDWVEELTRDHSHREPYVRRNGGVTWTAGHVTRVPPLVLQLLGAMPASSGATSGTKPGSRPAARIEAIDTVMLIDDEAERWYARLHRDAPGGSHDPRTGRTVPGSATLARISGLHGLHASLDRCDSATPRRNEAGAVRCCFRHRLEHDMQRWWHQARIVTGWDSPAYRPFNTCPVCEQRGGLRVNLEMQAALCIECRSIWASDEIGVLAEHIRVENQEPLLDQTRGEIEDVEG